MISATLLVAVGTAASFSPMNDVPGGYKIANADKEATFRGESYFEVTTANITYKYGDVYWETLPTLTLPDNIVKRFYGNGSSAMSITGWETNIYRYDENGKEVVVPAFETYNHHFIVSFGGARNGDLSIPRLVKPVEEHKKFMHGNSFTAELLGDDGNVFIQNFIGAEARGTYYYTPEGYALQLDNPSYILVEAMIINIGKPGGGRCDFENDAECLVPKEGLPTDGTHSAILECPCTDRVAKEYSKYIAANAASCTTPITTKEECFSAVQDFGLTSASLQSGTDLTSHPPGCSVVASDGTATVYFNKAAWSETPCDTFTTSLVAVTDMGLSNNFSLSLEYNVFTAESTVTMTGPSDKWFAAAFGRSVMDQSTAFVALGNGTVQMRLLGNHVAGTLLPSDGGHYGSLVVNSNEVVDGVRTVKLTYKATTLGVEHYMKDHPVLKSASTLPVIGAVGMTSDLSYHGSTRAGSDLVLLPKAKSECICKASASEVTGTIGGVPYNPSCSDELVTEKNSVCSIETYTGGLMCCRGGMTVLDQDQYEKRSQVEDTVHIKIRVYYEEAKSTDQITTMTYYPPEGGQLEYTIPERKTGLHVLERVTTAEDIFPTDTWPIYLVGAQGHCHTRQCLGQEMYNADTGELLCTTVMTYGNSSTEVMNEEGYIIGSDVCYWSESEDGLKSPPKFDKDTQIVTRKYANATTEHYGDMAGWVLQWSAGRPA